jgi:hypothetical protein
MKRQMLHWTRILGAVCLAVLLSLVLEVRSISARDRPEVEALYNRYLVARDQGDYVSALLLLSAYVDSDPQRMKGDLKFAIRIKINLILLGSLLGKDSDKLSIQTLPQGVSREVPNTLKKLWRDGCPSVEGEEIRDLVGTYCGGGGVVGDEDPLARVLNADPLLMEGIVRYFEPFILASDDEQQIRFNSEWISSTYSISYNWWFSNEYGTPYQGQDYNLSVVPCDSWVPPDMQLTCYRWWNYDIDFRPYSW